MSREDRTSGATRGRKPARRPPLKALLVSLLASFAVAACGNDGGGDVLDGGVRDTGVTLDDGGCRVEPTWTSLHDTIFSKATCVLSGCHAAISTAGNLNLSGGKAAAHAAATGMTFHVIARNTLPMRVTAGAADTSFFYRKLSDTTPPGGTQMPQGCFQNSCISGCELDAVKMWIEAGAANN